MVNWIGMPAHNRWLEIEMDRIFEFGRHARVPNGIGWMSSDGVSLREEKGVQLWLTGRNLHSYAAAYLMGRPGAKTMAQHCVNALLGGVLRDRANGGWFAVAANRGDEILDSTKEAYAHMFVCLGAASGTAAGIPGAKELLDEALEVLEKHFWDEESGLLLDNWDAGWTQNDDYRGGNANMHAVEAFLILHDVTHDDVWLDRAMRIAEFLIHNVAKENHYRVIEHFDSRKNPIPDYNKDDPANGSRAYGSTPGHMAEWTRWLLDLRATMQAEGKLTPDWLLDDAVNLFHQSVRDAWNVDGKPGYIYTVDWDGEPIVRSRIRWVILEAIASAYSLYEVTGEQQYADYYQEFWDYCRDYLMDFTTGGWWQELTQDNEPATLWWDGKQDIYHLLHVLVIPRLPLTPGLVPALAAGKLDEIVRH